MPVYRGKLQGEDVLLTLWRGLSEKRLNRIVDEQDELQDELTVASLEGVVESADERVEVEETFTMSDALPGKLETVAYRAETGEVVEFGALESTVSARSGSTRRKQSDCVRISADQRGGVRLGAKNRHMVFSGSGGSEGGLRPASKTYPTTTTALRYRTFIPSKKVGSPCGTFAGDNRGFSSHFDEPNRTRASVFFNWPIRTIDTTKHIGATKKLNSSGSVVQQKTASADGIKFHTAMMSGAYGRIGINHSVGNPLCRVAGPIAYNVIVEAWKDGSARIAGTRRKVPNHEAYVYPTSGTWGKTIFQRSSSSFICLSINCGQESLWETYP